MLFFFIVFSLVKESPLRVSLEIFANIFPRSYLATVQVTKCFKSSCYFNHAFMFIFLVKSSFCLC